MATEQTVYRVYVEGFSATLETVQDIQMWVDGLKAKCDLAGKKLSIWRGRGSKSCAVYRGAPDRILTISA